MFLKAESTYPVTVFDETVHPFEKLNPNAGARFRAVILLPQDTQPSIPGDELLDD
jgi:prolyl-tRNA editing enzyme YbaK/EbsC (Cys-tRNA(Pro) deacylase)